MKKLPAVTDDINIEEVEADKSFKFFSKWTFPNGRLPGPRIGAIMKRMGKAKAVAVPAFAEKARELGLDPEKSDLSSVLALSVWWDAVNNPSCPAAQALVKRLDGGIPVDLEGLKQRKMLEELPEEVLDALLKQARVIEGDDGSGV